MKYLIFFDIIFIEMKIRASIEQQQKYIKYLLNAAYY